MKEIIKCNKISGVKPPQKHGDWIDLFTAEDCYMARGSYREISLGISMELPKGYEALVAPRSSLFKNFNVIMVNSPGIIDEDYKGNGDIWHVLVYAFDEVYIPKNTRICQFRIIKHQPEIEFIYTDNLDNTNRGGIGSSGNE